MQFNKFFRNTPLFLLPFLPMVPGCGGGANLVGVGAYTGRASMPGGKAAQIGLVARPNGTMTASVLVDARQVDLTGNLSGDGWFRLVGSGANPVVVEGTSGAGGTFTLSIGKTAGAGTLAPASATPTAPFLPSYVTSLTKPQHWAKKELAIWVEQGAETRPVETLWTQTLEGGKLWSDRLPDVVAFKRAKKAADAQIIVRFVPPTDPNVTGDRLGQTQVKFYEEDKELISAEIFIETGVPDHTLRSVIAHEIGHAMGVNGHSPDTNDLMYPIAYGPADVTLSDANAVAKIYHDAGR